MPDTAESAVRTFVDTVTPDIRRDPRAALMDISVKGALRDAIAEMNDGGLKHDSVAITFDDGYASIHSEALPVLTEFKVPATVFVLTGWINRQLDFWWLRLRAMLKSHCRFTRGPDFASIL